jgi:hypothetical protein
MLVAGNVLADEPAPLALGSRLRVTTDERLVGRLVAQDEQSLTLQVRPGKDPVVVPQARIVTVERSLRLSQKSTGAAIGALVGALSAVVFGLVVGEDCSGRHVDTLCFPRGGVALASSVVLVPVGTLIGAVAAPGERWELVSGYRVGVRVTPMRGGGIAASASLRF